MTKKAVIMTAFFVIPTRSISIIPTTSIFETVFPELLNSFFMEKS